MQMYSMALPLPTFLSIVSFYCELSCLAFLHRQHHTPPPPPPPARLHVVLIWPLLSPLSCPLYQVCSSDLSPPCSRRRPLNSPPLSLFSGRAPRAPPLPVLTFFPTPTSPPSLFHLELQVHFCFFLSPLFLSGPFSLTKTFRLYPDTHLSFSLPGFLDACSYPAILVSEL